MANESVEKISYKSNGNANVTKSRSLTLLPSVFHLNAASFYLGMYNEAYLTGLIYALDLGVLTHYLF